MKFTRELIRFRKDHPVFHRRHWFQGRPIHGFRIDDIAWFLPNGREMEEKHWHEGYAKSLAVFLNGRAIEAPDDQGQYATVDDVGKAAKDWPQLNFIIYHSALRPLQDLSDEYIESFGKSGYIPRVSDLADIPAKFNVSNVYAELGTAFATSAITYPRHCAVLLGTLIKGVGVEKVLWGTDSIRYGSPQWQIEAFRRIEIPEDLRERFGFQPLGKADGPVKNAIFGLNAARLYGLKTDKSLL